MRGRASRGTCRKPWGHVRSATLCRIVMVSSRMGSLDSLESDELRMKFENARSFEDLDDIARHYLQAVEYGKILPPSRPAVAATSADRPSHMASPPGPGRGVDADSSPLSLLRPCTRLPYPALHHGGAAAQRLLADPVSRVIRGPPQHQGA